MTDLELVAPDLMLDGLPRPNLPLLRKVLDHIDAHPDEYEQRVWAAQTTCGTAYCVAGTALVMTGHTLQAKLGSWVDPDDVADVFDYCAVLDGDENNSGPRTIHETAARELGLTLGEAERLFDEDNSRVDVQLHAELIAHRAGERL